MVFSCCLVNLIRLFACRVKTFHSAWKCKLCWCIHVTKYGVTGTHVARVLIEVAQAFCNCHYIVSQLAFLLGKVFI